jgi:hypothetical protein
MTNNKLEKLLHLVVDSVEGIKFLVGNPEGEILPARFRRGRKSNVTVYFK